MLSRGASSLAAVAALKPSSEIKRHLCRTPAVMEEKKHGHKYFKVMSQSRALDICVALIYICLYMAKMLLWSIYYQPVSGWILKGLPSVFQL